MIYELYLDTIKNMETDCTHLKRQIELLRLDLERLNKLIYKETTTKTVLERNNLLSENDFVRELKVRSTYFHFSLINSFSLIGSRKRCGTYGRRIS